jgi:hypothetical protein
VVIAASLILAMVPGNNYMEFAKENGNSKPEGQGDLPVLAKVNGG